MVCPIEIDFAHQEQHRVNAHQNACLQSWTLAGASNPITLGTVLKLYYIIRVQIDTFE